MTLWNTTTVTITHRDKTTSQCMALVSNLTRDYAVTQIADRLDVTHVPSGCRLTTHPFATVFEAMRFVELIVIAKDPITPETVQQLRLLAAMP